MFLANDTHFENMKIEADLKEVVVHSAGFKEPEIKSVHIDIEPMELPHHFKTCKKLLYFNFFQ